MNFVMQPKLFETKASAVLVEDVLLYALGDFQSRGKVLAERELPLDRLNGAFIRAFSKFGIAEISDADIAEHLIELGVHIVKLPEFIAKRPFRVTVPNNIAERARTFYDNEICSNA